MKRLFVFFCIFTMFFGLVYSQQVSVTVNAPANANPNDEFKIDISIQKGDVSGFARLQFDFPEGFTVTSSETNGATFSYRENKARFLWMSLPADNTLKVSCLVKATTEGLHEFEGSFSYVLDNETQRNIIPVQKITIGAPALVAEAIIADIPKIEEGGIAVRHEAERLEAERKAREAAERKAREEAEARAEAERKAQEEARKQAESVKIEKEEPKEVVVVEIEIPDEVVEADVKSEEKDTSHEIVVVEIPVTDDSDRIEAERKASEEVQAKAEAERIAREAAAKAAAEEKRARERIQAERLAKEKAEKDRLAMEAAERRSREDLERRTDRTEATQVQPSVAGKVEFRVQVGASRQPAEAGYFRRLDTNIPEFNVVRNDGNDGWHRYTIGSFTSVEAAQQMLSKVRQQGFDCFVAAFKDGQRTTIAEAKRLLGQ